MVFIDLDEFKAVNDTEGHAVGDRLLVAAARRLRFAVGEHDTVGRLSGDEFAVVVCDDTGTSTGVWPVVAQVVVVVLLGLLAASVVRLWLRRPRKVRRPQRRAHVSATGELVRVEELRPSGGSA